MTVIYRAIPGFSRYEVGSDGSIWSLCRPKRRRLKGEPRKEDGRLRYTLCRDDGEYVRKYGSHFVLMAFVGLRPSGMEACHGDGNCLNDAASNLRWDTPEGNKADMKRHGTQVKGENHPKTKISDRDIARVIEMRQQGERLSTIADRFGVTAARVSQICIKGAR